MTALDHDKVLHAARATRPVSASHAEPHDGRLPITVTFAPTADLDAKGGVFIDFRQGNKSQQPGARHGAKAASPSARPPSERKLQLIKGDAALDALTAREAKAARADGSPPTLGLVKSIKPHGNPIVTHQIAKAGRFTTGQSETFRAEVSMPSGKDELGAWYFRGRIGTAGGHDVHSMWQKV